MFLLLTIEAICEADPYHNKRLASTKRENDGHYLHGLLLRTLSTQELQLGITAKILASRYLRKCGFNIPYQKLHLPELIDDLLQVLPLSLQHIKSLAEMEKNLELQGKP